MAAGSNAFNQFRLRRGHRSQDKKGRLHPIFIQQIQNVFCCDQYPPAVPRWRLLLLTTTDMIPIFDIDRKSITNHSHPITEFKIDNNTLVKLFRQQTQENTLFFDRLLISEQSCFFT